MRIVSIRLSDEDRALLDEILLRENVAAVKRKEPPKATVSTVLRELIHTRAKTLGIHLHKAGPRG